MLILIRHGQSTANEAGLLAGHHDTPLTEKGRAQARALAGSLSGVARLVASPLSRTMETARLAVPGVELEIDAAFVEQHFGEHEGRAMADLSPEELATFRSDHDANLGGGESLAELDVRVHARLNELMDETDSLLRSRSEHIVVVSHVSPIKSAVTWALGVPGNVAWRMRLDNASITTIAVREGGPYLLTYNDVSARTAQASIER